jgi:hypothetical protein
MWPSPCLAHIWILGGLPFLQAVRVAGRCGVCRLPVSLRVELGRAVIADAVRA